MNNQVDDILFLEENDTTIQITNETSDEIIFNASKLIEKSNRLIHFTSSIFQRWNIFVADEKICIHEPSSSLLQPILESVNDLEMFWNSITNEYPLMKHQRFDYYKKTEFQCVYYERDQSILCIVHDCSNPFLSTIGTRMIPIHSVSIQHISQKNSDFYFNPTVQAHISTNQSECYYIQTSNRISVCQSLVKHKFFYIHNDHKMYSVLVFKIHQTNQQMISSSSIAYERKKQIVAQLLHYYYKNVTKMNFILPQVAYNTCRRIFQEHKRFHIQSVLKRIAHENKVMSQWEILDTISTPHDEMTLDELAVIFHLNK